MPVIDHTANELLAEIVEQFLQSAIAEHDQMISESTRVNNILLDAAMTLRRSFFQIDKIVKHQDNTPISDTAEYKQAYHQAIASLQFEDIASQIINQQIKVNRSKKKMLQKISKTITTKDSIRLLEKLKREFDSYEANATQFESVRQQDLTVGEAELF